MLAVVKTPSIDVRIEGDLPPRLLHCLKSEFGGKLRLAQQNADERSVDFFETDVYREVKRDMTPGMYLRIYRENRDMTQDELGGKVGVSKAFICDIEHDRRGVSKEMAKRFSEIFNISVARFI